ncbi:MAG: pyridoxal phosphate-dependent aminotransferase family protein [Bacteroidota bacterium]
MGNAEQYLRQKLKERITKNNLRSLTNNFLAVDFCSNDYLGLARSIELKKLVDMEIGQLTSVKNGATGSRLLSGNHPYTIATEQFIADFHSAAAALLFNSGYDANVGLLSAIAQRGDTLITDELIHASLIDGARLSNAERYRFKHNDVKDLAKKIKNAKGICYVVVESIYSMDGDMAPLEKISALCKKTGANLIVDEAHAIGIFGDRGKGLINSLGLEDRVFARIVTFGKALGSHGAAILGSKALCDFLINFARSFIYTTAAPLHQIVTIRCAYQLLIQNDYQIQIAEKIKQYNDLIGSTKSNSCIQTILFSSANAAKTAASHLQNEGFDVRAIVSPTVAEGKERLRICLHLFNTDKELTNLVQNLKTLA